MIRVENVHKPLFCTSSTACVCRCWPTPFADRANAGSAWCSTVTRQRQIDPAAFAVRHHLPDSGHGPSATATNGGLSPPPHARCWKCATTIGWVSQFLRVIPRISALEVVTVPLPILDAARSERRQSRPALTRLNVLERLWHLCAVHLFRRRAAVSTSPAVLRSTIRSCS